LTFAENSFIIPGTSGTAKRRKEMDNQIKDLHIALDLARFLADDKRLKSNLNNEERKLANKIAEKIASYIREVK
jgi:hypothetical protein